MIPESLLTNVKRGQGYVVGELADKSSVVAFVDKGATVAYFDGVDTTLDYIAEHMTTPQQSKSSSKTGVSKFNKFASFSETITTFREHPESIANFDETEMSIRDVGEVGTEVDYDVTGDFIDMGRYLEGIPEVFGNMHSGKARQRRLRILVNLNQTAGTDEADINHRSERILRLVDALENGGARCEIITVISNETGHWEFKMKDYQESLAINDLAVLTHSEWLRRIYFRLCEYSPAFEFGYGTATLFGNQVTPDKLRDTSDNNDEIVFMIDGNMRGQNIDINFDKVERLLAWELSKPVPEVEAIKVSNSGVFFSDNGVRDSAEVQREGKEVIENES